MPLFGDRSVLVGFVTAFTLIKTFLDDIVLHSSSFSAGLIRLSSFQIGLAHPRTILTGGAQWCSTTPILFFPPNSRIAELKTDTTPIVFFSARTQDGNEFCGERGEWTWRTDLVNVANGCGERIWRRTNHTGMRFTDTRNA